MSISRKISCSVISINDHGNQVYTLELLADTPVPIYRPGQFLHLTVDPYDPISFWPDSRVFSIANSPTNRRKIKICYSVKGNYTKKMEQTLQIGSSVWVKLPYGDFFIEDSNAVVLIAGGTGITAYTAFLESLNPNAQYEITLIYGAKNPDLLLFQEMILRQFANVPKLNVIFFIETGYSNYTLPLITPLRVPKIFSGRIDLDFVLSQLINSDKPVLFNLQSSEKNCNLQPHTFYLSGPPFMIKTFWKKLHEFGIDDQHIRTDAWE